ncbi:MAG: MFS transporter [Bacillus sp. (in: firmicutes)]
MIKNKNVWILMSGEFIANLGLWLGIIGNLEFLQHLVPSDLHKSLILLLGMLAGVVFAPLAGKAIDRTSKRKVMLYASLGRILSVLFMFVAIEMNSILWMSFYMVLIGVANAFYLPALQACIPLIVKGDQLLAMNGLHMNIGTVARIMGTALAGMALLYLSLFQMYFLSMIAYAFIFVCTYFLAVPEDGHKEKARHNVKGGFKEVWPMLNDTPPVLMGLVLLLVPALFLGSFNLMVLEIGEMQNDPTIKSWLYTVEGIGFLAGAFIAKRFFDRKSPVTVMLGAALFMAISQVSLYFGDVKVPSIIAFAVFGTAAGVFYPIAATMFQQMVSKDMHGRFFSFKGMADRLVFQVVLVCTGLFLDTIGFKYMVLVFGGISMCMVLSFAIAQRRIRKAAPYTM